MELSDTFGKTYVLGGRVHPLTRREVESREGHMVSDSVRHVFTVLLVVLWGQKEAVGLQRREKARALLGLLGHAVRRKGGEFVQWVEIQSAPGSGV